ncbi:zinc-ribbon family protein [Anaerosphaera aminiphila DSM 21120]|uniref:Zinc-ribbon family protein n=1 Tax=Anaerosphaera aminiphila DSM 21120 TaxID=1120995 RepID=A0A1M5TIX3_9FIRM|nr:zinc ribbon domain-containing protein [Anaerosphaera aminiphila]SHH50654.1 zinc-ribbon family protein [Anaerosphaera aminiphila DSM 21120]
MFFIFGINQKRRDLDYNSNLIIHSCGKYGRMEVYMVYSLFSLFFIPIIKWNKKYFVRYTCCNQVFELDRKVGKKIEHGENVEIKDEFLSNLGYENGLIKCPNCGALSSDSFDFCPHCGESLKN